MDFKNAGGAGHGLFPSQRRAYVRFSQAASQWDLVQFDFLNVATGLSSAPGGAPGTSKYNTVREPDASAVSAEEGTEEGYWFGIAEEAQAVASDGWVTVQGIINGGVANGTVEGDTLVASSTVAGQMARTNNAIPTGRKIIAIAHEDHGGDNVSECLFDGINGFGMDT